LDCHEAENLYVADEVLQQIGTEWTSAANTIATSAPSHGSKAGTLANAANWNRMTDDLKNVINEISLAIDAKHVHWTQRVGVTLGRQKPTGQLAGFLGPSVIAALWP
jgi:hypothetical protein